MFSLCMSHKRYFWEFVKSVHISCLFSGGQDKGLGEPKLTKEDLYNYDVCVCVRM